MLHWYQRRAWSQGTPTLCRTEDKTERLQETRDVKVSEPVSASVCERAAAPAGFPRAAGADGNMQEKHPMHPSGCLKTDTGIRSSWQTQLTVMSNSLQAKVRTTMSAEANRGPAHCTHGLLYQKRPTAVQIHLYYGYVTKYIRLQRCDQEEKGLFQGSDM